MYESAIIRASKYRGAGGPVAAFRGITGINPYAYQSQARLATSFRPFCVHCGKSTNVIVPVCTEFSCVAGFNAQTAFQRADFLRHTYGQVVWLSMLNFNKDYFDGRL